MTKDVDTKEAVRYYNTNIFWVITLIPLTSFKLFYNINNCLIHWIALPLILLCSFICLCSLITGSYIFITRNKTFNEAIKYIKSLLKENNIKERIEEYIMYLDIFNISYNYDGKNLFSSSSKIENRLNKINKWAFYISIILFIVIFIYSYIMNLITI